MRSLSLICLAATLTAAACGTSTGGTGSCNGCEKGPNGNGSDSITITSVTGFDDGKSDMVVVKGNYTLASAASAKITVTCDGQSSADRPDAPAADAGTTASYTVNSEFQSCTSEIVKVTLFPAGGSASNDNYVKCCFKKGTDF